MAVGAFGSLVGAVVAGVLGEVLPVIPLLIVQGSGYVLAGLAVWRLTRGHERNGRSPAILRRS